MPRQPGTRSTSFATALAVITVGLMGAIAQPANALIIDAFRVRGPGGPSDEYIQVYNESASPHTVAASTGTGYGIAASDGILRCTIPNATVIPGHGHFLCANTGLSITGYPAGNGTTATGDATFTTDIPDNAGIALFTTNIPADFALGTRMDAVGSTSEANTLYKEGTGYPPLTPFSIDYSFVRDQCGRGGAVNVLGACPSANGTPIDTDNNAADFYFVDTNGTSAGAGQRLGAPGPQNLSSPIYNAAPIDTALLDTCATATAAPNVVRDFTSDPPNNSTFGTLDIRRTFTNNTGAPITRLRFRIIDLDTFPAASTFADMRPRTSTNVSVTVDRPPCGSGTSSITVQGTTLEQPPSQPNGSGFYGSMSVDSITLGTPLANGASVDVRFLIGLQQTGTYRLALVPEALPQGGGTIFQTAGCTEGPCTPPTVTIDQAAAQADPTGASPINFTVVFSTAVTGFTGAGVTLGGTAGATTAVVTGGPTTYNVAVSGMSGPGTVIATVNAGAAVDALSTPNAASTSTDNAVTFGAAAPPAHSLIIDAFRVRGLGGAGDEYVQVYNDSASPHTVAASSGTGYGIAASDGVVRCTIPNGTVIPARGHFLCASTTLSITGYPAGNGTTATGDATFTTDIPDNAGIALFDTNQPPNFALNTRFDAVGSTSEANTLYKEGTGVPAITPFSIDYSWVRDQCGRGGGVNAIGPCPTSNGTPIDTDNNAADFYFVDNNGTSAGGGQRLGTPGPQNLSSPIYNAAPIANAALDTCSADVAAPNVVRDLTSDPPNNSTFGTLDIRRTFTNNTGAPLTRLRFRIIDLDTFPAASTFSDMRMRTSPDVVVNVDRPPCGSGTSNITVHGTTLEQPPSQPNGSGFYGTLSVGAVSAGTPLANGASIDVRFLAGLQQTGTYRIALVPEALPEGGGPIFQISGCSEGPCAGPTVTIDQAAAQVDPATTSPINFTVAFSSAVTGFTNTDVTLSGTAGATTATVTGGPSTYNVAVSGMTNAGTVIATIPAGVAVDAGLTANTASTSTDNTVTFAPPAPTVTIDQDGAQTDPTAAPTILFHVVFSAPVTGFTNTGVALSGTAGATTASVTGGPSIYTVFVSGMTASGTVIATIPAGVANGPFSTVNVASTSTDNTVTFTGIAAAVTTFSGPSATGTGTINASFTGGSATCSFSAPSFIGAPPGAPPIPAVVPPGGIVFPHGLFDFNLAGCAPGSTMSFTLTYPSALPAGTQYWKFGPTGSNPTPHWYVLPATIVGNTATFTITDGGLGDDDLAANGTVVDQGGPGFPGGGGGGPPGGVQVPTLDPRATILLALMLLGIGMYLVRRRR